LLIGCSSLKIPSFVKKHMNGSFTFVSQKSPDFNMFYDI